MLFFFFYRCLLLYYVQYINKGTFSCWNGSTGRLFGSSHQSARRFRTVRRRRHRCRRKGVSSTSRDYIAGGKKTEKKKKEKKKRASCGLSRPLDKSRSIRTTPRTHSFAVPRFFVFFFFSYGIHLFPSRKASHANRRVNGEKRA